MSWREKTRHDQSYSAFKFSFVPLIVAALTFKTWTRFRLRDKDSKVLISKPFKAKVLDLKHSRTKIQTLTAVGEPEVINLLS